MAEAPEPRPAARVEEPGPSGRACSGCEREIEWCSFCDEPGCDAAICFGCLVVELGG
jgi:hypothetical protein